MSDGVLLPAVGLWDGNHRRGCAIEDLCKGWQCESYFQSYNEKDEVSEALGTSVSENH
jgi:hypothetical protein